METLDKLNEIPGNYFYYDDGSITKGTLLREDVNGDTEIPPYRGRYTILERADSRKDAVEKARQWNEACN